MDYKQVYAEMYATIVYFLSRNEEELRQEKVSNDYINELIKYTPGVDGKGDNLKIGEFVVDKKMINSVVGAEFDEIEDIFSGLAYKPRHIRLFTEQNVYLLQEDYVEKLLENYRQLIRFSSLSYAEECAVADIVNRLEYWIKSKDVLGNSKSIII